MRSTEHLLMIRLGDAQRRNTDPIPLCKSLCAICPLFIDTDFAIAQQPVQMAFGGRLCKDGTENCRYAARRNGRLLESLSRAWTVLGSRASFCLYNSEVQLDGKMGSGVHRQTAPGHPQDKLHSSM